MMPVNMTQIPNGLGHCLAQRGTPMKSPSLGMNPALDDGFALGRWLRAWVIDPLTSTWLQKAATPRRSASEIRIFNIYRDQLNAMVTHLERNLCYLRMNPKDEAARTRIVAALKLKPSGDMFPDKDMPAMGKRILAPLKDKISMVADPCLKNAMRKILSPILFSEEELVKAKEADLKDWKGSLAELEEGIVEVAEQLSPMAYLVFGKREGGDVDKSPYPETISLGVEIQENAGIIMGTPFIKLALETVEEDKPQRIFHRHREGDIDVCRGDFSIFDTTNEKKEF